jgi:predicted metalloprotease with PDZ domain
VFDAPHGLLHLEPGPDLERPFRRDRTGLNVVKDGSALVVQTVAPGSPAEADGWTPGTRIVAIDGRPIDDSYWSDLYGWQWRPVGSELTLTDDAGRERRLVLADYY